MQSSLDRYKKGKSFLSSNHDKIMYNFMNDNLSKEINKYLDFK